MLGKSSRFFAQGYAVPKYELLLGDKTLFVRSVSSFDAYFTTTPFLFLVRKDYGARKFILRQLQDLNICDFRVIEFEGDTTGQAESVFRGLVDYSADTQLMIFNTDTIRDNFVIPSDDEFGDGFLEVFHGEGDHWSFVESASGNSVLRTTEKDRISDLCSNGIYGFSSIRIFRDAYTNFYTEARHETYIAPMFNQVIKNGGQVRYRIVDSGLIRHCGVPTDYEFQKDYFDSLKKGVV